MAPKAKQQAAAPKVQATPPQSEAKAKAKAEPKKDQPTPKAKAEPKAKAAAETAPPKAAASEPAQGKAKAKSKSAAQPDTGVAKSVPAQPQKQKQTSAAPPQAAQETSAKAKGKAKAQPSEPKSGGAPAPKGKAKAKAEPAPPPPAPEPEPVFEEAAKKKKTNHRGGRNKNKEETGPFEDVVSIPVKPTGPSKNFERATASADKDAQLKEGWDRYKAAMASTGPGEKKTKLETLVKDIDEQISSRQVRKTKHNKLIHDANGNVTFSGSDQLEQSLNELQMRGGDASTAGMIETVKRELAEAVAFENWVALKKKFEELKAKCEEVLKPNTKMPSTPANSTSKGNNATNSKADHKENQTEDQKREEGYRKKLLWEDGKAMDDRGKIEKKTVELDQEVMRYLFAPPHRFSQRFVQNERGLYNVLLEQHPKGGKGAGKSAPKETHVIGNSSGEVDKCVKALQALDFSGLQTKSLDGGMMVTRKLIDDSEKEFSVIIFQNRSSNGESSKPTSKLELFGPKKAVEAALKKIEDNVSTQLEDSCATVLAKVLKQKKNEVCILDEWRKVCPADIQLYMPRASETKKFSAPTKITITGKTQREANEAMAKVAEFKKKHTYEVVEYSNDDYDKVKKWDKERSNDSFGKMFRDIKNGRTCLLEVLDEKENEKKGVLLAGEKANIETVKGELQKLLVNSSVESQRVTLGADKIRLLNKDDLNKISDDFKLFSCKKEKEDIVLHGEPAAVERAIAKIHEECEKRTAASETIMLTEQTWKKLTSKGMPEVKAWQNDYNTSIDIHKTEPTFKFTITGSSPDKVEAVKKEIEQFAKQADNQITKERKLQEDEIGRVIGNAGATKQKIQVESGAKVECKTEHNPPYVKISGTREQVAEADRLIDEALGLSKPAVEAKPSKDKPAPKAEAAKPAPRQSAKKAPPAPEFKNEVTEESFPSLGGTAPAKQATPRTWGKTKAEEKKVAPATTEEAYPSLPAKEEAADEDEEAEEEKTEE